MPRIFVDTNVFLRFLTGDDPAKADSARRLFASAIAGETVLETSLLVIAEIVWTLESFYELTRPEIGDKVTAILSTPNLEVPEKQLLLDAAFLFAELNVDFIDAYHGALLERRPGVSLATFDRKHFKRFPAVELYAL